MNLNPDEREIEIMLICKAKHLYIAKMGESTYKFDFERIVPVFLSEPSRLTFCANRPGRIVPGRNWFLSETSRNHGVYRSKSKENPIVVLTLDLNASVFECLYVQFLICYNRMV